MSTESFGSGMTASAALSPCALLAKNYSLLGKHGWKNELRGERMAILTVVCRTGGALPFQVNTNADHKIFTT